MKGGEIRKVRGKTDIMQKERYSGNSVIERGYAIYDEWNNKKYKSRDIVNRVENAVAVTNAKKTSSSRVEALSYLFALDLRINERYNNIIKCIFLYFSWKRETSAFKRLRDMLRLPEGHDVRALIEIELERIRSNIDVETAGADKNSRGGKSIGLSSEESTAEKSEQQTETVAEEALEENIDNEKDDEKNEKNEEIDKENSIEKSNKENKEETVEEQKQEQMPNEADEKTQKESDGSVSREKIDIKQENFYKYKAENNGFEKKREPITDKRVENTGFYGAIDTAPAFVEMGQGSEANNISFIDEVIMDNMVKGETDIVGHNPLKTVNQEHGAASLVSNAFVDDKNNGNDAHLYDKIVLNAKDGGAQSLQNAPQEKIEAVANDKPDEARIQIKVDENLDDENAFRNEVTDKFSKKMIYAHKFLMEDALREELIAISDELGIKDPIRIMGEVNIEELQAPVVSRRKH